ncbi:MAG: protein-L-isoaspartate O-methyltransferase family protein [Promethearchaeota archaeon]|jgi:protein-L-isoaspartate(D-aspartate) O-methyltransferase
MENRRLFRSKIQLLFSLHFNGYLRDIRLFKAFLDVPLKDFIPQEIQNQVRLYNDAPVLFYLDKENPASLRTISAPHMISIMLQELILNDEDDLLILGAKSGYIAMLAHKLAPKGRIVILEANSKIAKITAENLNNQKLNGEIEVIVKNPLEGLPEMSPWQKILVTGAIKQERIFPLLEQLDSTEGVLFAPIGENYLQIYTQIIRFENDFYGKKYLQVRFTPLITQIELDELKLVTDIADLEAASVPQKKGKPKSALHSGKININYTSDVLEEVRLEPYSKNKSYEINDDSIYDAIKEHMEHTINTKNKDENRQYLENINKSLDQINKLIFRLKKDLKEKGIVDPRFVEKKIRLIEKYQLEVSNIQKRINKDIR